MRLWRISKSASKAAGQALHLVVQGLRAFRHVTVAPLIVTQGRLVSYAKNSMENDFSLT